jgi:hypothetical protein
MQKLFFSFLLMLFCLPIFSQDETGGKVKITMSPAYENDKKSTFIEDMMYDKGGNILIVKTQTKTFSAKSELIIEKYSPELTQKFSKELIIKGSEGKDLDYVGGTTLDREPYIFSSFYNKDKDTRYLFISKVEETGSLGKPKKLSDYPADGKKEGGFDITFNEDSSRMLIINRIATRKKENRRFSFIVYDKSLTEIWKADVTLPYESRDVGLSDFKVDKESRVYVLASVDNDSKSKKDADIIQEIFVYSNGEKQAKRYNLDIKGKLITELHLHEDKNGDLIAVGTYASTKQRNAFFSKDRTSPLGTVIVKINRETGAISSKTISPFKKASYEFFRVKEKQIEDGKGIPYLRLENSWISADNSINLDLEQNYLIVRENRGRYSTSYTYYYYSDLAMLVRYDTDGKVKDEIIVPKKMSSINQKKGLSHLLSHSGNETYMIYNDSPKNWGKKFDDESDVETAISPETSGLFNTKKKPQVVLCTINAEGKKKYARLFNFKDDDVFLNTESSLKLTEKSFVVIASYRKDFKLVKITL